jgi:hypothetical protein
VTDVLLDRGNAAVAVATARNPGASFSEQGYAALVARADGDDLLTEAVGMRPAIPRHHFVKLLARASNAVFNRLIAESPHADADISAVVDAVATRAHAHSLSHNDAVARAQRLVARLDCEDRLGPAEIESFAHAGEFETTCAALACLTNISLPAVESMMVDSRADDIMALARMAALPWPALRAVLAMRDTLAGSTATDLAFCRASYERLKPETARQILRTRRDRAISATN